MKCPKCGTVMELPQERADGLPGVLYRECLACGHTSPVTRKTRKETLPDRKSFAVAYRRGGTHNATWHRVLETYETREIARQNADEVERMGYKALIFDAAQLDRIGLPEGYDADAPLT